MLDSGPERYAHILRAATRAEAQVLRGVTRRNCPPIKETTSPTFAQTGNQVTLTPIVRQACDHPLLALATQLRETLDGAPFPRVTTHVVAGLGVEVVAPAQFEAALLAGFASHPYVQDPDYCRVLTWTHARSGHYNTRLRRHLLGPDADRYQILPGERLVTCSPLVAGPFPLPASTLVTVKECRRAVDEFGIEVYRVHLVNVPGEQLAPSRKTLRMPRRLRRGGMSNLGSGLDARYPDRLLFVVFKSPAACGGVLYSFPRCLSRLHGKLRIRLYG
jgi:hypothetical protein